MRRLHWSEAGGILIYTLVTLAALAIAIDMG